MLLKGCSRVTGSWREGRQETFSTSVSIVQDPLKKYEAGNFIFVLSSLVETTRGFYLIVYLQAFFLFVFVSCASLRERLVLGDSVRVVEHFYDVTTRLYYRDRQKFLLCYRSARYSPNCFCFDYMEARLCPCGRCCISLVCLSTHKWCQLTMEISVFWWDCCIQSTRVASKNKRSLCIAFAPEGNYWR